MRPFLAMFLLSVAAFVGAAEPVSSVVGSDGAIDPAQIAAFVAWAGPSIREYPPKFKDKQHQEQVTEATQRVVTELSSADIFSIKNQMLLTDMAHIFAMAHNINLGTAPKSKSTFEKAISLNPNDRRTNYLFGMFLISTRAYHFESLPYLEKAYALGEKDAQFSIGLLLVEKGEKEKGLAMLEAYAREHPGSAHTQKLIKGIKDGTLKFNRSDG